MNASHNMKSDSTMQAQLDAIRMTCRQREAARHAAGIAELFVGAIVWVGGKLHRPHAGVFAKPDLRY